MKAVDRQLDMKGYLPMSGLILDATLAPTPTLRATDAEQEEIKAGKTAVEIWPNQTQKDLLEGRPRTVDGRHRRQEPVAALTICQSKLSHMISVRRNFSGAWEHMDRPPDADTRRVKRLGAALFLGCAA